MQRGVAWGGAGGSASRHGGHELGMKCFSFVFRDTFCNGLSFLIQRSPVTRRNALGLFVSNF